MHKESCDLLNVKMQAESLCAAFVVVNSGHLMNWPVSILLKTVGLQAQYEATKAYWKWTPDRPDFIQAAKSTLQQSDVR